MPPPPPPARRCSLGVAYVVAKPHAAAAGAAACHLSVRRPSISIVHMVELMLILVGRQEMSFTYKNHHFTTLPTEVYSNLIINR